MGNSNCLVNLMEEFSERGEGREKAIISFKVQYYETGEMQVNAFPHKNFRDYSSRQHFETYYFAGGAHAIRREVFEKLGGYPIDFFYGMEEYDLSYRVLDMGYSIVYSARIVMLHKESPFGRKTRKEKQAMMWINKAKVAYRYLPLPYFYSTSFMWSIEYLKKTGLDLRGWIKGWQQVNSIPGSEKRTPVSDGTLRYLRKTEARLWY
jgi:GT2 family glycosyltransferase